VQLFKKITLGKKNEVSLCATYLEFLEYSHCAFINIVIKKYVALKCPLFIYQIMFLYYENLGSENMHLSLTRIFFKKGKVTFKEEKIF